MIKARQVSVQVPLTSKFLVFDDEKGWLNFFVPTQIGKFLTDLGFHRFFQVSPVPAFCMRYQKATTWGQSSHGQDELFFWGGFFSPPKTTPGVSLKLPRSQGAVFGEMPRLSGILRYPFCSLQKTNDWTPQIP